MQTLDTILPKATYTQEETIAATVKYFKGDDLAARVWLNKYALKDSEGNIYEKSPEDMHHRIAGEIARIEQQYPNPLSEEKIFNLIKNFKYIIPQGSPMTGIGNPYQIASLSNCFVIGNDGASDSYGGIMNIDEEQVQLVKPRGGVAHDLSHIRPKSSPLKNSALLVPFSQMTSALCTNLSSLIAIIPPSPEIMFLVSWKEKADIWPIDPKACFSPFLLM